MKIKPTLQVFLLVFLFLFTQLSGQTTRRLKILGVAVKGNESVSANSIKVQSGLLEGKEIIFDDIPDAIKKLWSLKIF